jgi:hypothetical protein
MIVTIIKWTDLPKDLKDEVKVNNGSCWAKDTAIIFDYCVPTYQELTSSESWENVSRKNWISEEGNDDDFTMKHINSEGQWAIVKKLYDLNPEPFCAGFEMVIIDCNY